MTPYDKLHDRIWDILMWEGDCDNASGVAHEVIAEVLRTLETLDMEDPIRRINWLAMLHDSPLAKK